MFARPLADTDYLILACDGVWDVLSDAEAVRIARSTRDPAKIAVRLRDTAIDRGSKDNISVLCIQLNSDRVPLNSNTDDDDDDGDDGADTTTEETDAASTPNSNTRTREPSRGGAPPR